MQYKQCHLHFRCHKVFVAPNVFFSVKSESKWFLGCQRLLTPGPEYVVRSNGVGPPQVRNLTYMVTRREKMKRSLWKVQEQIFQQQVRLLDQQLISG